jgi:type VI secretion system protein ImpL
MVSVPQLAMGDVEAQKVCASMRERIDAVLERLEVVVPVYLTLTKADSIPGFAEFWAGFKQPDQATWGASFSLTDEEVVHAPERAVAHEIEMLAQSLHGRLLDRMLEDDALPGRVRALRFPIEFRLSTAPVARLAKELCRPGPAPERFVLRGVYLVCAARDGAPSGASYFLTDFFRAVVLADRNLAAPSRRALQRRATRQIQASFLALGLAAMVLVPAAASYLQNVSMTERVRVAAAALRSADPSAGPGTQGDPIETALDTLDACDDAAAGVGIPGWWSPRAARQLRGPFASAYLDRLGGWISTRLKKELDRRLDAIASGSPLSDAPSSIDDETPLRDAYATVKLSAFLADPGAHGAEGWAVDRLVVVWRSILPEGAAVSTERLTRHARNYVTALAGNPGLVWPSGRNLTAARERLRRLDVRGIPYRRILLAARDVPAVRANSIFGSRALSFLSSRGDVQVPGPFTAGGWDKIREVLRSSEPLPAGISIESWVLDDASLPRDDGALRAQVRQAYFDEYVRRWMSFLDELKVKTPTDVTTASAELSALKEGDGFYRALFDAFRLNVVHDDPPGPLGLLNGWVDAGGLLNLLPSFKSVALEAGVKAAPPSPVETSFQPLLAFGGTGGAAGSAPLDKYLAILDKLKAVLEAPPDPSGPGQSGHSPFNEASTGVASLLDGVEEPTRGRLWRLLMPPVMGGVAAAKAEGVSTLSDDWRSSVWTVWDQKLRTRFPFSRAAHAEAVDFGQFTAFFKPDGVLWGFVKAHLADWVEDKGDGRFALKQGAEPLSPLLLSWLTTAKEVTDAFFSAGEDPGLKLSIQVDWTATNVADAKFVIGSKETPLPKAQWAGPVRWFGEDVHVQWLEDGRATEELGRHSFSLFDLFQHLGGLRPTAGGRAVYVTDCPPLTLKVRSEGKDDALRSDFFSRLRCPDEIGAAR